MGIEMELERKSLEQYTQEITDLKDQQLTHEQRATVAAVLTLISACGAMITPVPFGIFGFETFRQLFAVHNKEQKARELDTERFFVGVENAFEVIGNAHLFLMEMNQRKKQTPPQE
ncbi:MAG TPA: hypothetical protein VF209_01675 [Patescibacteria group bacterium]